MNRLPVKIKQSQVLIIGYNAKFIVNQNLFHRSLPDTIYPHFETCIIRFNVKFKFCKAILNISIQENITQIGVFSARKSNLYISNKTLRGFKNKY